MNFNLVFGVWSIINSFRYTLKDITLDRSHNYMSKLPNCIFLELTQAFCNPHRKTRNDEQIYMELKNMKQEEIERVEVYYEQIQKLLHGLQVPTKDNIFTIVGKTSLQSSLKIATLLMKRSTLQQHNEATMLC